MSAESRIRRWTGSDDWQRVVATTQDPIVMCDAGVLDMAAAAAAAARAELDRGLRRQRLAAWLEVGLGGAGLAALVAIATLGPATLGPVMGGTAALAASTLLAAVPLWGAVLRAAAGQAMPDSPADEVEAPITGRAERENGDLGEHGRRHRRYKVVDDHVLVTTHAGATVAARLIDVSVSGAAISSDMPDVRVGDSILVGSRPAKVVRTLERGFACAFVEPVPVEPGLAAA